jgi:hypothetical protein
VTSNLAPLSKSRDDRQGGRSAVPCPSQAERSLKIEYPVEHDAKSLIARILRINSLQSIF